MSLRRRPTATLVAALLAAGLLAAPASATPGGASYEPSAPAAAGATEPVLASGTLAIGTPFATASAGGITLTARSATLLRERTTVSGNAPASLGQLRIEQLDARAGWVAVATARVAADGGFKAAWRPRAAGQQQLRAVAAGGASSVAGTQAPQLAVDVFRTGVASWYGPGFYGGKTACGLKLRKTTLGVAHKTLPCGTQVQLLYRGKTLTVPVIDRGPFIKGRSWDLTKATHSALGGLDGLVTVGAQPLTNMPALKTPYRAPPIRR